jgi:general nucleoside transport system permease protein
VWEALSQLLGASFFAATLRLATPLYFATLGGIYSERSGVVNIGLEGMMLMGAFFGTAVTVWTGSVWLGVMGALVVGSATGLFLAFFTVTLKADQIVCGIALNLLALGFTNFMHDLLFRPEAGANLTNTPPFPVLDIPFLSQIPFLGEVLFDQNLMVYAALILVPISTFILFRTVIGLTIRSVGEHTRAADTVGINVNLVRYACVAVSGALAGVGGSFLSLGNVHYFVQNMTAGRGYIALAAVIFGKWHPVGALVAVLIFGAADAFQYRIQALGVVAIPPQFPIMLPYILTIIALAVFIGRSVAPAEDGKPYVKEHS